MLITIITSNIIITYNWSIYFMFGILCCSMLSMEIVLSIQVIITFSSIPNLALSIYVWYSYWISYYLSILWSVTLLFNKFDLNLPKALTHAFLTEDLWSEKSEMYYIVKVQRLKLKSYLYDTNWLQFCSTPVAKYRTILCAES